MLLLTLVFDKEIEDAMDGINRMKIYFHNKNITLGISESIEAETHFVKFFCNDEEFNAKLVDRFKLYVAYILYQIVVNNYTKLELQNFLLDTYFFLKYDEIKDVTELSIQAFLEKGPITDESSIYCMNQKNSITEKIIECLNESSEINVKGFITFRMKELTGGLENIIDRVTEKYMVEKEYSEFIKLLKYFVEVQEVKIDEVNIVIEKCGNYNILDKYGKDIFDQLLSEVSEAKLTSTVSPDDMLISGLITNSPGKINIHCVENCTNPQLLETIKSVFQGRVNFCEGCKKCKSLKQSLKI